MRFAAQSYGGWSGPRTKGIFLFVRRTRLVEISGMDAVERPVRFERPKVLGDNVERALLALQST